MARLIWTQPVLTDLEVIAEYTALDNPDVAAVSTPQAAKHRGNTGFAGNPIRGLPRSRF